jgi:YegS/Rv2252/BmrU family lipid kinase
MHDIVYNPMAGRGRARRALAIAEAYFAEHAMPYRVHTTTRRGHAADLVKGLPVDALVIAVGGDGTAHEVARGCINTSRSLGVVPSGSGDDFAFALGLDRSDVRAALDTISAGRTRVIDAGAVNGETFINAMGAGFDADVAAHVQRAPSFLQGPPAYLYAIFTALKDFALADAHVEVDGNTVHDGPTLLVSAQNGPRTGSSFLFAPEAALDDGMLEVLIAGRFTRMGALGMVPKLMSGRHLQHPEVRLVRGKNIRITWSRPRLFHMEGELGGPVSDYEIRILPRSLKVFSRASDAMSD